MLVYLVVVAIFLVAQETAVEASDRYMKVEGNCFYHNRTYKNGETVDTGECEMCECIEDRGIFCFVPFCPIPRCVDSVPGTHPKCPDCGHKCPNGENCLGPNGVIIPAQHERWTEGQVCRCVESGARSGGPLTAACELGTTYVPTSYPPSPRD